jgi:Zn-dependent M28 family amino/carboxypeptidase
MVTRKQLISFFIALLLLAGALGVSRAWQNIPASFDGERAYEHILAQMSFGPRLPGSEAHAQTVEYIVRMLKRYGWKVEIQETEWNGFEVRNLLAYRGDPDTAPEILIGAHYDSRIYADQNSGPARSQPVPGANDGASGVAVLLELARVLPSNSVPVWLVFFDAEDNGGIQGRDWIMGSRAFAAQLAVRPQSAVIVDMVGDADLNLYLELNSSPALAEEIWAQAASLGYAQFIPTGKYSLLDDHLPFLEAGIPAVDIIDFDYPYWHTGEDTADKVSPESLEAVGRTLQAWIMGK